ncbi:type II toxin-antitoxin system VapC family toxin [soil metagenome]
MKRKGVLLDTHAMLWWVTDDPRLSDTARTAITSSAVVVSVVSLWEAEIKRTLGRIEADTRQLFHEITQTDGFSVFDVRPTHVLTLGDLPLLHWDPFDRMLVAQALRGQLAIVTRDEAIGRYAVEIVW